MQENFKDKNIIENILWLSFVFVFVLPLMRVPVTSLCRDKTNFTNPCLQRCVHPVILVWPGTQQKWQNRWFPSPDQWLQHLYVFINAELPCLLLVGCMSPAGQIVLFLLWCFSLRSAGRRKREKRSSDFHPPYHPLPSPTLSICFWMYLKSWQF